LPLTFDLRSPEWPWKVRVGANSPNLWPTMFSVTKTGTNLRPLCTAKVRLMASGMMVDRRDQVLIGILLLVATVLLILLSRCPSMNGPFFTERGMACSTLDHFFPRERTIMVSVRLLLRVLKPLES
jgi:hypothetical protein